MRHLLAAEEMIIMIHMNHMNLFLESNMISDVWRVSPAIRRREAELQALARARQSRAHTHSQSQVSPLRVRVFLCDARGRRTRG